MKFLIIVLMFSIVLTGSTFAADSAIDSAKKPWKFAGAIGLSTMQSSYSDNWDGSEEGTLAWLSTLDFSARRQMTPLLKWRNTVKLEYGQQQTQNNENNKWSIPSETSDLIDMESTLFFTMNSFLDPFVAGRCESYFTDDRGNEMKMFNPMTFTETIGVARTIWDEDERDWIVSAGLASRQKIDANYVRSIDPYETETNTTFDAGIRLQSEFSAPLVADRLSLSSKFSLYQAIYNSETDDLKGLENENYWKATDVDLETTFNANITSIIMVNLKLRLLYDKEIDLGGRFRQALSAGLTYNFF